MSKVAIVTDSNSGITQSEAKEYGVTVMPMPFFINDQTYYEDIDLTQEDFYQKLSEDANISTSMPLVGNVTDTWDELLQEYDEIVHIPMSSGLSGSCETAIMLSQDYDGRVQVVNNQRISVTQRQSVLDAKALAEKGYSAEAIKEILEREKMESSIYIMVDTLYYLKKGGRITPAAAALGTLLKLKPVLQIQGEKLDSFAKARTVKQAKKMMVDAMRNDFDHRFNDPEGKNIYLEMAYTHNLEDAEAFKKEVEAEFPGMEIVLNPLSLSETAIMLSQDYDGRVQVVNNQRISVTQRQSVLDAKALAEKGYSAEAIKEILEREKMESSIYIMVDTLYYLKKGGRITPAAAALGTLLKLKPVLQIQGEKLDSFAKARTVKQAKKMMVDAMRNDFDHRFNDPEGKNIYLEMAYTHNLEDAEAFKKEVEAEFPGMEIVLNPLSLSVSCHIGPGALAVACSKKIPELLE